MSDQPHPLEYHVTHRPRRRWGLLILGACAVLVLIVGWKNGPLVLQHWRQFVQMRHDRTMMAYEPPAGAVAWDDTSGPPVIGPSPSGPPARIAPLVFMHGRKTTGGQEALVMIQLIPSRSGHGEHLAVTLYEPATWNRWTRHHGPGVAWEAPPIVGAGPKKIYMGRADPGDPSHFTVEYLVNGQKQTLDGWLMDIPRDESGATVGLKMADRAGDGK